VSRPGATCPRDRGRWPRQGAGGYKLGHSVTQAPSCARPAPAAGTGSYSVSSWPHRLTSLTSARAGIAPRALLPCPFSCLSKSFHVWGTLRGAGVAEEALTLLRTRACRPSRLKRFFYTNLCVNMKAVGINQPAKGDGAIYQGFRHGFRAEGPWPSASA
jgi:hypothetical protein